MREVNLCVTAFLWNALWQAPLLLLIAFGMTRAVRACGAAWEHRIWAGTLLLEVVLPAASATPAAWVERFSVWVLRGHSHDVPQITVHVGALHALQGPRIDGFLQAVLLTVYGLVSAFAALRLLWLYVKTVRVQREAQALKLTGRAAQLWDSCRERFQLGTVIVVESSSVTVPLTCGLRRPWLVLPRGLIDALGEPELLTIFTHECVHIQRNDFAKNLLYQVLALPLAWHPALWLTRQGMAGSRECLCDELATAEPSERGSYARSLLRLASLVQTATRVQPSHAIGIFDANTLEDRIMRLTEDVRPASKVRRAMTAAACAVVAIGACAPAWAWGTRPDASHVEPAMTQQGVEPLQVGAGVMAANIDSRVQPIYPPEAKAAGVQGTVVLDATIGTDGTLTALKLVSGPPELAKAAWAAVSRWTWRPYLLNGVPTAVQTTVTVNFQLNQ